jgi:F0F1-type ATP synthase assembly protein I
MSADHLSHDERHRRVMAELHAEIDRNTVLARESQRRLAARRSAPTNLLGEMVWGSLVGFGVFAWAIIDGSSWIGWMLGALGLLLGVGGLVSVVAVLRGHGPR